VKRGRWGKKRRRLGAVALGALALAVAAQLVAPGAGAVVANPGDITVQMRVSVITPTFKVEGVSSEGTGRATLSGNGLVNIPQASLVFAPTPVHIDVPSPPPTAGTTDTLPPINPSSTVVVTVEPTSDFYGGVDPNNGSGFLVGNVKLLWDQTGTLTGCTIGPFRVVARSNEQGARPYDPNSGKVTMVDPGFTLDALPAGAAGCGGYESGLNSALSLPVTTTTTTTQPNTPAPLPPSYPPNSPPPVPSVVAALTFTPAPRRAPVVPPQQPNPPTVKPPIAGQPPAYNPPPQVPNPGGNLGNNGGNGGGNKGGNNGGYRNGGRYTPPPPPARRHRNHSRRNPTRRNDPSVSKPTKPPRHNSGKPGNRRSHPKAVTRGTYLPGATRVAGRALPPPRPKGHRLNFVPAAFVHPSQSILATGLDIVAFIGLLVFSSLALWLCTSEISAITTNSRRLRAHRIAGVTERSWPK
jgi:hypothetical protein